MSHTEFLLIENLLHARDVITNRRNDYDLSQVNKRIRVEYQSDEEWRMWGEEIRAMNPSKDTCKIWTDRLIAWQKTGELPLYGGSYVDPKWSTEYN
ncbi:hypothetical protein [Shewanella colwelliana]|uniref:hypothetical protein n=1 Tax=Shewanella colwelliana TaxID=23 RepID=UPI0012DBE802|nr:hypothetical protein [Shewanella colwelliana]